MFDSIASHEDRSEPPMANPGSPLAEMLRQVLEGIDYGVAALDADGNVLLANRRFLAASAGALCVQGSRLIARQEADEARLRQALRSAARGLRTMVQLGSAERVVVAAVVPLAPAGALILLGKRATCEPLSLEMFGRTYRLTGTELAVLSGLSEGYSPRELATRQRVALSTVRTQLSSIRAKTRTNNLRALLLRLTTLPPILPLSFGVR